MKKYNVTVNGTVYEVEVEEITADTKAAAPAVSAQVKKEPAAAAPAPEKKAAVQAPKPAAAGAAGSIKITAPMPGNILTVNVSVGDKVKKGGLLCMLEAMKMENEILAPEDCTVASVNVQQGMTVQTGELLFTLN